MLATWEIQYLIDDVIDYLKIHGYDAIDPKDGHLDPPLSAAQQKELRNIMAFDDFQFQLVKCWELLSSEQRCNIIRKVAVKSDRQEFLEDPKGDNHASQ